MLFRSYVIVRVDDILVSCGNDNDHLRNLEEVLKRLAEAELRLKKGKCVFMESQVTYLGHRVSKEGIQPMRMQSLMHHLQCMCQSSSLI